jgi:hypothetical protein
MSNQINMENYSSYVEALAREGKDQAFFNSGPNHAAIVMSRMFKYSNNLIRIYCGGFNGAVSNDEEYLSQLQGFLERGGRLHLLVEKDNSNNEMSKIYKVLRRYKNQVDVQYTPLRFVNEETRKPIHFSTGDKKMIRVETGTDDYTAQVNFGSEKDAEYFISAFDKIFNNQENRKIPLA